MLVLEGRRWEEVWWGEGEKEVRVESIMLGAMVVLNLGKLGRGGARFQRRSWREER